MSVQRGRLRENVQYCPPVPPPYLALAYADCEDALTCALVARLFVEKRGALMPPEAGISPSEGWIWVPRDVFAQDAVSSGCT